MTPHISLLARVRLAIALVPAASVAACVSTTPPTIVDSGPPIATADAGPAPDAGDAAQPTCTVPAGTPGNDLGIGMYCLAHQNQCPTTLFCSADFVAPAYGFCSKVCKVDADCGRGIFCYTYPADQGGVSVCVPLSCMMGDGSARD
jgi:hypothetical protein